MFAMRTVGMMSLLSVVLMVHYVIGHCTDCVPKDGEDNKSSSKRQAGISSRLICGDILAVVEERNRNNIYSHYAEDEDEDEDEGADEDDDEGADEDVDYSTDSDLYMNRMMGGRYALRGEVPWFANIMLETSNRRLIPICGAAILSEYWVLTAADCFFNVDRTKLSVLVGDHTRSRFDQGEQLFEIGKFVINENYKEGGADYNIVLVNLLRKPGIGGIRFNSFIQPVCLPNESEIYRGNETLIISGMGLTSNNPRNKRYAPVVKKLTVSPNGCTGSGAVQSSRIFCLGNGEGETICEGDSGAPAVAKNGRVYVLYGIVAYDGTEGCQGRTLVAKVYEYRKWITDSIRGYSQAGEGDMPSRRI